VSAHRPTSDPELGRIKLGTLGLLTKLPWAARQSRKAALKVSDQGVECRGASLVVRGAIASFG
jgi:hypothetical protein